MEPQYKKLSACREMIYTTLLYVLQQKEWTSSLNVLICILNIYIGLMGFIAPLNCEFGTDTYTPLKINDKLKKIFEVYHYSLLL